MKFYYFFLPLVLLFSLATCNKNDYIAIEGVEEVFILPCYDIAEDEIIISDTTTYIAQLHQKVFNQLCLQYEIPSIDFSQKTLIGKVVEAIGCDPTYEHEVLADVSEKMYIYRIIAHQNGACQDTFVQRNWVIVPKLPDAYTVSFEVNYKN